MGIFSPSSLWFDFITIFFFTAFLALGVSVRKQIFDMVHIYRHQLCESEQIVDPEIFGVFMCESRRIWHSSCWVVVRVRWHFHKAWCNVYDQEGVQQHPKKLLCKYTQRKALPVCITDASKHNQAKRTWGLLLHLHPQADLQSSQREHLDSGHTHSTGGLPWVPMPPWSKALTFFHKLLNLLHILTLSHRHPLIFCSQKWIIANMKVSKAVMLFFMVPNMILYH